MEQKTLAKWLKTIIVGVGICGLAVCALILPDYGKSLVGDDAVLAKRYWPWLVFLWLTAIPCYAALVYGWKIAANIGLDRSFSNENALYLKRVALLAAGDTVFFFAGNVILLFLNMSHPGVMLASLLVVFAGFAVTVAAMALSHLVHKAALLQEQSDLTI